MDHAPLPAASCATFSCLATPLEILVDRKFDCLIGLSYCGGMLSARQSKLFLTD